MVVKVLSFIIFTIFNIQISYAQSIAAGCFIQNNNRLLMVQNLWSHKWGLPEGRINSGESTQQAAKRETLEETGINVIVLEKLYQWNQFAIFRCINTDAIPVTHLNQVAIPNSSYNEIIKAQFVDLSKMDQSQLRVPEQKKLYLSIIAKREVTSLTKKLNRLNDRGVVQQLIYMISKIYFKVSNALNLSN